VIFNDAIPEQSADSELVRAFSSRYELRDCAVDKNQNRVLAVNAIENNVWIYSTESSSKRIGVMRLSLPSSLSSPEGIAVDSEGYVWIADWGNHRALKFDSNGEWLQSFGVFGRNAAPGARLKLTFPTRIAVLEDLIGTKIGDGTYYREDYLIVADHNGIHVSDMSGNYLHTALSPNESRNPGSFYGFKISGHNDRSRLFLVGRGGGHETGILEFIPN
ncbi:SMP-30/gluconolactonase/LRE family protein, partial [bacterium]|nr:SMP-30/gluconolactonase/LRE family protein [bacterium]